MQYRKSRNRNRKRKRNRKSRKGGVSTRKMLLQFPIMNRTTGVRVVGVGNPPEGSVEEVVPPTIMDGAERFLRELVEGMPGIQILGPMRLNIPRDVYEIELNVNKTQEEIRDWIQGSPILQQVFRLEGDEVRYSLGRPTITWAQN